MKSNSKRLPRLISPGVIIIEELIARGWTQRKLAKKMQRPIQAVNEIVKAKKAITPQTAIELSKVFGTSAEFWLNLETNYQLQKLRRQSK